MTSETTGQPTARPLLAQADLLLLLAEWLSPPWRQPAAPGSTAELDALLEAAGLEEAEVRAALAAWAEEKNRTDPEDWRDEYTGLFEANIPCPINETAYIRRDKGVLLSDINGFYRAFGFTVAEETHEKPDHLVCELQFAAMLLVMEARAADGGAPERAAVAREAASDFVRDHLGEWLPIFCNRLTEKTSLPAMQRLSDAIAAGWAAVAQRQGWPQPEAEPAAAAEPTGRDDGTPYECDMADNGGAQPVNLSVNGVPIPR